MNRHFLNFKKISAQALTEADRLVKDWLPQGKVEGREYTSLNPKRCDQNLGSFKINLSTGKWADFASGDRGGDLISLYAYLNDLSQKKAAQKLASILGVT